MNDRLGVGNLLPRTHVLAASGWASRVQAVPSRWHLTSVRHRAREKALSMMSCGSASYVHVPKLESKPPCAAAYISAEVQGSEEAVNMADVCPKHVDSGASEVDGIVKLRLDASDPARVQRVDQCGRPIKRSIQPLGARASPAASHASGAWSDGLRRQWIGACLQNAAGILFA